MISPSDAPVRAAGTRTRSGNAMLRTRVAILDAAAACIERCGVRRTTMSDVSTQARIAKATLYNHFRTKDDVVTALLAAELDRLTTLAAARPLDEALAMLSDEIGAHPVLRRLASTEPETLIGLLAVGGERWSELTGRLGGALGLDADAAELAARWLLGVVLQPGRSTTRRRSAARLAALLAVP